MIICMQDGKVVQIGDYNKLLMEGNQFSELINSLNSASSKLKTPNSPLYSSDGMPSEIQYPQYPLLGAYKNSDTLKDITLVLSPHAEQLELQLNTDAIEPEIFPETISAEIFSHSESVKKPTKVNKLRKSPSYRITQEEDVGSGYIRFKVYLKYISRFPHVIFFGALLSALIAQGMSVTHSVS